MKSRKVLVKNVSKMHPLLANCLRLTVGTADENAQMLAALKNPYDPHTCFPEPTPRSPATPRKPRSPSRSTSTAPAGQPATGIGFFDHMLDQIARHGLIDLDIQAKGDLHIDGHHTVEDVGITSARPWPRPSATRRASAATATPTCRWTRRCRAW
jgi:hypothetical protein